MPSVPLPQGTGTTRRKLKKPGTKGNKFSTEKGGNRGKPPKLVSYCPECPPPSGVSIADPEKFVHVSVSPKTRKGSCKNRHSWVIGGPSYNP